MSYSSPPFAAMTSDMISSRIAERKEFSPVGRVIWLEEDLYYAALFNLDVEESDEWKCFKLDGRLYCCGK